MKPPVRWGVCWRGTVSPSCPVASEAKWRLLQEGQRREAEKRLA